MKKPTFEELQAQGTQASLLIPQVSQFAANGKDGEIVRGIDCTTAKKN